jgi:transcriptional regulator with XRE-family HTH domain
MKTLLGLKIKELREKKGLTQEEIADKLGVKKQSVSKYESGKVRPEWNSLLIIAKVTDGDINELEKLWLTEGDKPIPQSPMDVLREKIMELQDKLLDERRAGNENKQDTINKLENLYERMLELERENAELKRKIK